ncbi:MAG: T9SS type A sorting domain-containing protein [Flavisolibacter sp.]
MKNAFTLGILLCMHLCRAQGPQQLLTVPYDTWPGATVPGWLYLPADYSTSGKNYPVVIFYHGVGEAGTDPYKLLNQGIPNLIANGMRPDNITNPLDGQQYSFIVLSVQHWSWSPNPLWLPNELLWMKQNYRIDTNRVYVTGLSAGGQESFSAAIINNDVSKLVAASVPMSPAQVWPYDPTLIGQNKIKTWFFSGDVDPSYTGNATTYSNDCNSLYPGSSALKIFPGGHCCWNTYYNTSWHDPSSGLSIWEWLLTNVRAPQTIVPLPVVFTHIDLKKEPEGLKLSWNVSQEVHVVRYEVEKSTDGKNFSKTGVINASALSHYEFVDATVLSKNYYRIRTVDADGKFAFSVVLKYEQARSSVVMKAFPLPAQNEITVQHPSAGYSGRMILTAADGKEIKRINLALGEQETRMNLSGTGPGLYFLRFEDGQGEVETIKVMKN